MVAVDTEQSKQSGRVFLSHTSSDKPFVSRLAADLASRDVDVWFDQWEMRVGDSLVDRIQGAIQDSGYLAIVLSPKSVESAWVRRELNAALAQELERREVFILPVLAKDCPIPLFLRDKLYADFRSSYLDGLSAVLRTVSPSALAPSKLVFDSRDNDPHYATWGVHHSCQASLASLAVLRDEDGNARIEMCASASQSIGLNKSVSALYGRVEFEYRVERSSKPGPHVYFAMIPIQETGYGRTGVIEVGGDRQADERNPTSPFRIRYPVPNEHQTDGLWHVGTLDFDFRDTPTAFYSIFAARINEGASRPDSACLATGRVRVYSW